MRSEVVKTVPVLMYHRIGECGSEALRPYCITAEEFERQLLFLRRRGYYSLSPNALDPEIPGYGALPGRPVILTFDDAYRDFLEIAWPIIERNGFSAHVFVPTGHVGGSALWDVKYGEPSPLMTWSDIGRLATEGVTFGSHLISHRPATIIGSKELFEEALFSKRLLEEKTGQAVTSIAPPYGAFGFREKRVFELAGYTNIYLAAPYAKAECATQTVYRLFPDGTKDLHAFSQLFGDHIVPPDAFDLDNRCFERYFTVLDAHHV